MNFASIFTVSNFATMAEIQPLVDEMPHFTTVEELDQAQREDKGPSRATASDLIAKMTSFKTQTQEIYLRNMSTLDKARDLLADKERVKYMSLFEIAHILLPSSKREDGTFHASALYAVHTALHRDELTFRPLSPTSDCHRRDHLFEIFPRTFTRNIDRVATMVRDYWMSASKLMNPSSRGNFKWTPLGGFVLKARQAVLSSRKTRSWEKGAISPSTAGSNMAEVDWSQASWDIITFLQWWASYDLFDPNSRFYSYGATILRILDLYDEALLDQSTGWTFLQEIGVVPLCEIPSRYRVRFPDTGIVKGGGLAREGRPDLLENSLRPDIAAEYRTKRAAEKVFCIDGPSAFLIDDGVSLEATDRDDEFWIHVHAADPTSRIIPNSELSKYMEIIPENIYLKGHFQSMLSGTGGGGPAAEFRDFVEEFSLSPGSPALTFSARVNLAGEILDHKVEPSRLHDVLYMDPQDVAAFCNEPRPPLPPVQELSVGRPPRSDSRQPTRTVTSSASLDARSKNDLMTLYRLAEALKSQRLARGAWPYFPPKPSIRVETPSRSAGRDSNYVVGKSVYVPADPYISVVTNEDSACSVVGNLMVLAGQVAARWCAERNIPVPFRKDTLSAKNFDQAYKYATEVVYPQIARGEEPSVDQRGQLSVLTGKVQLSTSPGPHFAMGIDMYAKATSPLRRFSDLLVHWQIHAALAYEHETSQVVGSTPDSNAVLPYSEDQLARTLSLLQMREKMARAVSQGDQDWILMALSRAWRFEGTAPAKFRFVATSKWKNGLIGNIDLFKLKAMMEVGDIEGHVLIKDVKIGDTFDVELVDVNVHSRDIMVRALRHYPKTQERPRESIAAAA